MARTRVPPQGLTKVNVERLLKKDVERNKQRAEARKAAKEAAKAAREAEIQHQEALREQALADREAENRAARLKTAREDAEAVWFASLNEVEQAEVENGERSLPDEVLAAYLTDQGIAPDGSLLVDPDAKPSKATYHGPMEALKSARTHYVKGANGILCNGDPLALLCSKHDRATTVKALIVALKLEGNPYAHLNPGQQSMNLRNKARAAIKAGTLTHAELEAAFAKA